MSSAEAHICLQRRSINVPQQRPIPVLSEDPCMSSAKAHSCPQRKPIYVLSGGPYMSSEEAHKYPQQRPIHVLSRPIRDLCRNGTFFTPHRRCLSLSYDLPLPTRTNPHSLPKQLLMVTPSAVLDARLVTRGLSRYTEKRRVNIR